MSLFEGFGTSWDDVQAAQGGVEVPEGLYDMVVDNVKKAFTKKDNSPLIILECRVLDGKYSGQTVDKLYSEKSLGFLKGDLAVLGVTTEDREPEEADIQGRQFAGYVKYNTSRDGRRFQNLYMRGPVGSAVEGVDEDLNF